MAKCGNVAPRTLNFDTEVGIVTVLWAGRPVVRISAGAKDFSLLQFVQSRQGQKIFLFSDSSRRVLESIEPHVQWALGFIVGDKVAGV